MVTQAYKRGRYDSPCVTCLRLTPTNNFPCFPIKQYAPAQTTSTQAVALPYQTTLGRVRGGACGCHGNLQFLSISSSLDFFFLSLPTLSDSSTSICISASHCKFQSAIHSIPQHTTTCVQPLYCSPPWPFSVVCRCPIRTRHA